MNTQAYDISHLSAQESTASVPRNLRVVAARPAAPAAAATTAHEELAGELMQSAAIHEALIQQYLRISRDTGADTPL
ncbi:MAG: hypothetical protein ABIU96_05010 [Rhodanobacter sp.]